MIKPFQIHALLFLTFSVFQDNALLDIDSSYGENNETFVITFIKSPPAKTTVLQVSLSFVSQLTSTLKGFYRVDYDDIDSSKKLVSQF